VVEPALLLVEDLRPQREVRAKCRREIFVVECEHEELIRVWLLIWRIADRRKKVIIVGDEQCVLRGSVDDDVLAKGNTFKLGGNLKRRQPRAAGGYGFRQRVDDVQE
jgi:hypothetical protein